MKTALLSTLLLSSLLLAAPVRAQPAVANHANGLNYQPTPGQVGPAERNAGIAPSAQQQQHTDDEVERLNRQLQNTENNDPQLHPNGVGKVNPNR